jgi:tRNA-dihydrouridine synthase
VSANDAGVDDGSLARAAFVRSWMRSLLSVGRNYSEEQLLESAKGMLEHLALMEAAKKELEMMAAKGRR